MHGATPEPVREYRDPLVAGLLGLFPGGGHAYLGLWQRGATFLVGTIAGLFLFAVPGAVIWAISVLDAWRCARRRNLEAPVVPMGTTEPRLFLRASSAADRAEPICLPPTLTDSPSPELTGTAAAPSRPTGEMADRLTKPPLREEREDPRV